MPKRKARSRSVLAPRLYRVFPWLDQAAAGQPGHPLYRPRVQGAGRVDNPENYRVLYASDSPIGAIAEAFGNHSVWTEDLFIIPSLPGALRALATFEARRVKTLNLDDAQALLDRGLRPSDVVTRDRSRSRSWALLVFGERKWDGVRWWSHQDPDRGAYGLWRTSDLRVLDITFLDIEHSAVTEAAASLNRWIES
jgi:hypothetical protein